MVCEQALGGVTTVGQKELRNRANCQAPRLKLQAKTDPQCPRTVRLWHLKPGNRNLRLVTSYLRLPPASLTGARMPEPRRWPTAAEAGIAKKEESYPDVAIKPGQTQVIRVEWFHPRCPCLARRIYPRNAWTGKRSGRSPIPTPEIRRAGLFPRRLTIFFAL